MRRLTFALLLLGPALAAAAGDAAIFHGWSKDGSWFAFQTTSGPNELTELFFCATEKDSQPTWPKDLDQLERQDGRVSCVRYTDPNRAPYGWKQQLTLPKPSPSGPNGARVDKEFSFDVERPGYVVETGTNKKVTCYVSGLREDSRLGDVYWHPNGRWVAAFVDGNFTHCDVPLKAGPPAKPPVKKKKGKSP
jgi:hypothetical protein